MNLDNKLKNWYLKLNKNVRTAFVSTIIIGLVCHIYMMTNKWVNLDDIVQIVDTMNRTTSGRWFLMFPSAIGSEFSLPWLNGFLTISYTAFISSIIVQMFDIKSKINTILISGILVTFPTLGSLMPFMNTQDAYQFGALLATLAAYFLVKKENGYIFTIILLTLSLGIYQTYLGFSAGLVLIYILIDIFKNKKSFNEIFYFCLKMVLSFILSIILYIIISRGIFGKYLVDYKGLDTMGSIPLNRLPEIIFGAYKAFFLFFIGQEFNYHWVWMPPFLALIVILTVYLIVYLTKKSKLEKKNKLLTTLIVIFFPLAINIIYVMSFEAGVMLRMAYGYTIMFIFPLILLDYIYKNYEEMFTQSLNEEDDISVAKPKPIKKNLVYYSSWILTIILMLNVYNNIYVTNKAYFKVGMTNEYSNAYANRIAMRIEMVDGYTRTTKIMMLGNPDSRTSFTSEIDTRDIEPFIIANHLTRLYSFKYYPKLFLGLPNTIYDEDEIPPELEPLRATIESMPIYPEEGSMKLIDDTIYIKFKDVE